MDILEKNFGGIDNCLYENVNYRGAKKKANLYGVTWGVSQCLLYFSFAAAFGFGGYLVGIGEMDFNDVFRYEELKS